MDCKENQSGVGACADDCKACGCAADVGLDCAGLVVESLALPCRARW